MDYLIVVVDDEALCLTNVRNLLHEENMKAVCLRSGKDLIKYVQKNTPDLILLDIFMPEMDGFTTYKALREYESQHGKNHVPVIFLTGVGKVYPIVRTHKVLSNLRPLLKRNPLIVMYPGTYINNELSLFGEIDRDYYQAFKLILEGDN